MEKHCSGSDSKNIIIAVMWIIFIISQIHLIYIVIIIVIALGANRPLFITLDCTLVEGKWYVCKQR